MIDMSETDYGPGTMTSLGHAQPGKSSKPDSIQCSSNSPSQMTAVLNVTGMHCQSCVKKIEGYLRNMVGVISVKVNLENKLCHVAYDPSCVSVETLRQAVESAGDFKASLSGMFVFSLYTFVVKLCCMRHSEFICRIIYADVAYCY